MICKNLFNKYKGGGRGGANQRFSGLAQKNYFNIGGFLEKSLKIKYVLKSTGKLLLGPKRSLNLLFQGINLVNRESNQYKTWYIIFCPK